MIRKNLVPLVALVTLGSTLLDLSARRPARASAVARVGAREISASEVVERARRDSLDLARALDALVDEEAFFQEAHRRGLEREDKVVRRILILAVFLADVSAPAAKLVPTEADLAASESEHRAELARLEGEPRAHERAVLWLLDARSRLAAESVARARAHAGVRVVSPGRTAALVGTVPILADDVRVAALVRKERSFFGAEELARPVSLEPPGEPGPDELARALAVLIDEEALVQEGLRRGYDRDEPAVSRRLVARILEELEACSTADDEEKGCTLECPAAIDPVLYSRAALAARRRAGTWLAPDRTERLAAALRGEE